MFKCSNTGIPVGLINVGYSLGMVVVILLGVIFVDLFGWTRIFVCFATMPLVGKRFYCSHELPPMVCSSEVEPDGGGGHVGKVAPSGKISNFVGGV